MSNKYCPIFKQKIEELKEKTKPLEDLLLKYRETRDENIAKELEIKLKEIEEFIEEFKEEFTKRVYELLEEWYPKSRGLYEFLQNIKINEKGRVEIEELDVSYCGLSSLYLPSLFEKIKKLYCSDNKLKSLPELLDSLEDLYCSVNQLESLPTLPASLKVLDCSGNKLKSLPKKLPDSLEELYCSFNELKSLPKKLPARLKKLYCSGNKLKSLPKKLPDSLEELYCSDNQLTSLPELPKGLKELKYRYNPLTIETIKKIRSHPNYKPYWEIR
jgi:Leucine-rich repeat (LRR) protein